MISATERLRKEDSHEFEARLDSIVNSRPVLGHRVRPCLKDKLVKTTTHRNCYRTTCHVSHCQGLNCPPKEDMLKSQPSIPQNVTQLGNILFIKIIKLK